MPLFVIEYELPYTHRVQVGVEAESHQDAIVQAEQAFAECTIWDDTAEMPLLFDDYEESNDSGALVFKVVATVGKWPDQDASVIQIQRGDAAMMACRLLVDAGNAAGASDGQINWEKAYRAALHALGMN